MVLQFMILMTWFGLANLQWNYKVSDYEAVAFYESAEEHCSECACIPIQRRYIELIGVFRELLMSVTHSLTNRQ